MNTLQNQSNQSAADGDGDSMSDCVILEDIMFSILTRLPVKSLLRFRSVCKAWLKLFTTPTFIKLHHRRQFSSNRNFTIYSLSKTDCAHTRSRFNTASDEKNPIHLDYLFVEVFNLMDFVGCYNGVICMAYRPPRQGFILWNPATRMSKFTRLPNNEIDIGKTTTVSLGFKYDEGEDDFKVLRFAHLSDGRFPDVVEVYSAKLDSWKTINHHDLRFRAMSIKIYSCLQCSTMSGKITVLCFDGKLFAFDADSESVKEIDHVYEYQLTSFVNYRGYTEDFYEYTQSLVCIDGMEPVMVEEEEEEEQDDDRDRLPKGSLPADVAGFFRSYFRMGKG